MSAAKIAKLSAMLASSDQWDVRSVVTVPMFVGEVTEETITTRHGYYTREEITRPGYQLDGWVEAGYRLAAVRQDDDEVVAVLKNGPLTCSITYALPR